MADPTLAEQLAPQVQANCHRADARLAARFSLCGLLLRLRNLYKWEHSVPPWQEPDPAPVLDWVSRREEIWLKAAEEAPARITLAGRDFDPFQSEELNRLLAGEELVYGAGLADGLSPIFFLAHLRRRWRQDGLVVWELDRELAPDLLLLPGMRADEHIFLRRQPLAYLLWDLISDDRPSTRRYVEFGLAGYGLERQALLAAPGWAPLEPVLSGELETVLWHERGEAIDAAVAGALLQRVVEEHPGSELEHFVRGVKDLLADTGDHGRLSSIIAQDRQGSLGLYPAWLKGFVKLLFPEIGPAVDSFIARPDWQIIAQARDRAWQRASEACQRLTVLLASTPPAEVAAAARQEVIEPLSGRR